MRWDRYGQLTPAGPNGWLTTRDESFSRQCPFAPAAADEDAIALERFPRAAVADGRVGRFDAAFVGHVVEPGFRENGSSGGMVSWVAVELLRTGAIDGVAHVVPCDPGADGRFFQYRISRTPEAIGEGAKSRYYPVELTEVLREIRATPGRYAVVGVPCFIKAVHLLRRIDPVIGNRITHTLGLFCGHMKSARFVQSFAWQLGAELERVRALDYRIKDPSRPANWYRAHLELEDGSTASQDWWHLADGDWGAGFFQNAACNFCDDVVAETADIAFGDAWVEPYASDGHGTNVLVVRSPELARIVDLAVADGRLALQSVDAEFIVRTQAAGFRHRRDGLAYRLSWSRGGVRPRKRVAPRSDHLPPRRKLIYRMRAWISRWSHRMMWLARATGQPRLYLGWARATLSLYGGLTYSRGPAGAIVNRVLPPADP